MVVQGLVEELQRRALDGTVPVSTLLRYAKTIAVKLDLSDALVWINGELNGYMDQPVESIPPYRIVHGQVRGLNPYHGWQPVQFENTKHAELFSTAHLGQSIGAMTGGAPDSDAGTTIAFQWHPATKQQLLSSLSSASDVMLELSSLQIAGVVDAVRNVVLDWALELEKKGISGEGMTFSFDEKREAKEVSHNYFIQNAGVVGNVSDQAQVRNQQSVQININIAALQDVVGQARAHLSDLPEPTRTSLEPLLADIEQEIKAGNGNQGRLRELVESAKRICEAAAGNLTAAGIGELLSGLF